MNGFIVLYGSLALAVLDSALKIYQLAADRAWRRRLGRGRRRAVRRTWPRRE